MQIKNFYEQNMFRGLSLISVKCLSTVLKELKYPNQALDSLQNIELVVALCLYHITTQHNNSHLLFTSRGI